MDTSSIVKHLENVAQLTNQLENTENLEEYTRLSEQITLEREQMNKLIQTLYTDLHTKIRDNKKRFSSEINTKKAEILATVSDLVKKYHDPTLIDPELSPNENTIYKIYSDFEVTSEKGGWAYGSRTLFSYLTPLFNRSPVGIDPFPCPIPNGMGYAIMKLDHCLEIYNLMRNYIRLIS